MFGAGGGATAVLVVGEMVCAADCSGVVGGHYFRWDVNIFWIISGLGVSKESR